MADSPRNDSSPSRSAECLRDSNNEGDGIVVEGTEMGQINLSHDAV